MSSTGSRTEAELRAILVDFPGGILQRAVRDELEKRLPGIEELCASSTDDPALQILCSIALRKLGRLDDAFAAAVTARRLARTPSTAQALSGVLRSAASVGHPVRRFEDSIDPDDVEAWLAGGHALAERSCVREAARWFERVLRRQPHHVEARALRAYALWLLTIDPAWVDTMRALSVEHPDSTLVAGLLAEMALGRE